MKGKIAGAHKRIFVYVAVFLLVNVVALFAVGRQETRAIDSALAAHAEQTQDRFETILSGYRQSFQVFSQMMAHEIETNPDPDHIWDYLKQIDAPLLEIEGETFDGLYMSYQGRYLYSWDTPYEEYAKTGYVASERPWYKAAAAGQGEIVFTPPYMSYANHYILTTISQLRPDGETVFAYDIKMGDIQELVSSINSYPNEQIMIFDQNGTVIGSTEPDYLGGCLYATMDEAAGAVSEAENELQEAQNGAAGDRGKLEDKLRSATSFYAFRQMFDESFAALQAAPQQPVSIRLGHAGQYGYLLPGGEYNFMILAPKSSLLQETLGVWLLPLLGVELLLIYIFGRSSKNRKNRELKEAYVELGQTQRRLEIALSAAQKAAAIDDLTGMMNFKSFHKAVINQIESMDAGESGLLLMLDGDHFKAINDQYGHNVGDEVIKLTAQMIIGRIRTVDLASRLHGDEFAIFVANTADCEVGRRIMDDINVSLAKEAARRNMPAITLSAGAVVAKNGDSYTALSQTADEALYRAKETHNGGYAYEERASI